MSRLLLSDTLPLKLSDLVGVIIKTEDGHYLLQHRWDRAGFYFPGFWGLFGGGVKPNETPQHAAGRELKEELGLDARSLDLLMHFEFDFVPMGLKKVGRWFYVTQATPSDLKLMSLNEGVDVQAFSPEQALLELSLVYYDAFAIWALESRNRLIPA